MKTIIKTAIVAFTFVAGASAGHAQPGPIVWHFPVKGGAPYATQSAPVQQVAPVRLVRHAKHTTGHVQSASKTQLIR